jgi:hypothetical protein
MLTRKNKKYRKRGGGNILENIKSKYRRPKTLTNKKNISDFFINFKNIKITRLDDEDYTKVLLKLKNPIPECCTNPKTSYYDVLVVLSKNFTEPVFIVGGAVRDYMITKDTTTMNDIDINYTIDPTEVEKLLITPLQISSFYKDARNYIRVGPKNRSDYLEGFYINPQSYEPNTLECKMNSLLFMINKDSIDLVDFFGGDALKDAENKVWSSPTLDYDSWLKKQEKLLWRLLKFELRGYTVPVETKEKVYTYFIKDTNIKEYGWQNIWWTLNPDNIVNIIEQIKMDCLEIGINYGDLLHKLIIKKLLIANKI